MEPDLNKLAEEAIEEVIEEELKEERERCLKVKTFKHVGSRTKAGYDYYEVDGQKALEEEMNAFLQTLDSFYVENVNIQVVKNFLPDTGAGEYEEVWYGTIVYEE